MQQVRFQVHGHVGEGRRAAFAVAVRAASCALEARGSVELEIVGEFSRPARRAEDTLNVANVVFTPTGEGPRDDEECRALLERVARTAMAMPDGKAAAIDVFRDNDAV